MRRKGKSIAIIALLVGMILHMTLPIAGAEPPREPPRHSKVDGTLRMLMTAGQDLATREQIQADTEMGQVLAQVASTGMIPVYMIFHQPLDADKVKELERDGMVFHRLDGEITHVGRVYSADVPTHRIEAIAADPSLELIESAWKPGLTPPLDLTVPEINADEVWAMRDSLGRSITGHGIVIADLDTGVDVFHPALFKADGGTFDWIDENGSGGFEAGLDYIDLDGNGSADANERLRFIDASDQGGGGLPDTNDGVFRATMDWLYNDANNNSQRDYGTAAGFVEASPTFGEQLFIVDDLNGNDLLDVGETLLAQSTSKVLATRDDTNTTHTRGVDLIQSQDDTNGHGTSVSGILAANTYNHQKYVGVSPDAELLVADIYGGDYLSAIAWAQSQGAHVILHEIGGWVQHYMDGSSAIEQALDAAAAAGIVQVVPSGNLAGSGKHAQADIADGNTDDFTFNVVAGRTTVWITVLWRDTGNNLDFALTQPGGTASTDLPDTGSGNVAVGTNTVWYTRADSSRGTARYDIRISGGGTVASGGWTVHIGNSDGADETVHAFAQTNGFSWSGGINWTAFATDESTMTWPSTADSAISVANYHPPGRSWPGGDLASSSGRGPRIDGAKTVDIAAPGNWTMSIESKDDRDAGDPVVLGKYTWFSGTSAAGPHVAGTSALMLQRYPTLNHDQVKAMLQIAARSDAFTDVTPNDEWGYGKIDALASVSPTVFGLQWLRSRHSSYPNGSWSNDVGITSLATLALLNHGYDESDPDVQSAIQYLLANVRSDGSIYNDYYHRNYQTSLALLPLKATQNSNYTDEIEAAKNWLVSSQWDDSCLWGSVTEANWYWGGFGYGRHIRPDLSNSQFSLLALDAADLPKSDPAWSKALTFVSRCQNRQASNDGFSPYDDGGFIYYPGGCLAPGCASYGSITGAGIWGLALAGRTPDDPRFKAALDWVEDNYTWDYNPLTDGSWGNNSLYYYYLSMSKALSMARRSRVGGHDWYQELSDKLTSLQQTNGSWVNSNSWLNENIPELATSYALLALQTRQLPTGADLELVIILHSPADLHLYDAEGRHVGKNYATSSIDLEVPGSSYSPDDPQTISIHPPVAGNYHLELVGTGEGDWQIEIIGMQDGVQVSYDSYGGSITPGAVLATDLNVGAFEGALTIFSSQPAAAPVLDVDPTSLSLTGQPGDLLDTSFTVSETGGNAGIQGVGIFATDLTDGSGDSIPGANVTFDPNNFDIDPGASQSVDVSVSVPGDVPDGDYSGSITVESLNAGTKSVQLTVEVRSNTPPTADANGPYYGNEGEPLTLDASASSDPDENITLYEWDLDNDGEYDDAVGVNPEVVFYQDGTYPIGLRVTDEYGESDTDSTEVQVENVAPGVSADVTSQEVQYSDYIADVTVTATDVAGDALHLVGTEWKLNDGEFEDGLPDDLELTSDGCSIEDDTNACDWTLSGIIDQMASDYTVRVTVADEDGGQTEVDIAITVLPESAIVVFAGDNPVSVRVEEDGGDSGPFSLAVTVSEKEPDEPIDRAASGDISLADVKISLVPVGPGGLVEGTCTPGAVSGLEYEAELPVTCNFDNVPVNTYSISATVSGGFFTGANEDVLTVYDPSLGFATGGGWFYWPGTTDKTNFGFTMKYKKNGDNVKGSLLLIRHVGDDAIYRVKSNALYGLALGTVPTEPMGWASFSGKCTYLEPGWPEPIGNYEFVVYVEDLDEPGTGVDRAWIEVLDKDNNVVTVMAMGRPAIDNAVELGGGNVAVPH